MEYPAHQFLWYSADGLPVQRYWDLQASPHTEGRRETIDHIRFFVEDSVRRQLVSDMPLCTMLSGGLDSSILSALAAAEYQKRGEVLHTWSVDYADNSRYFHAGRFVPSEDAPFADGRIVEYAYNLPWTLKSLDGREKGILRAAFEDILTPEVAWREKSPYPKTFHPAYFQRVMELFQQRMERPNGILPQLVNRKTLDLLAADPEYLTEPWYGQLMRTPQVFAWLVMLDAWMERFAVELV